MKEKNKKYFKSKIFFKCPYNNFSCVYINTCGMSVDTSCDKCEHYHNGVKETGAMPILGKICNWIKFKNKHNNGDTFNTHTS